MAYFIRKSADTTTYGVVVFTVDEESDISTLPRYHAAGSTAYVIASGNTYMLNNKKEWILSNRAGGSGSGSGSGNGGGGGSSVIIPTPININIGTDATAATDSQGNVNIVINNQSCCGGGGEDIEWDDLADGQQNPSSGGSGSGGCCGGGDIEWETIVPPQTDGDIYWETIEGSNTSTTSVNPQPDNPDPTPTDPDPTPVDPDPEPIDPDPTPVEPDPEPEDPSTVTLKTGFGGAPVNSLVTQDYNLKQLIPGMTYNVQGTGKGYYYGELQENFDIDTTVTIPDNYNEKTIIKLKKYNNQQNLVTGLEIRPGFTSITIYYNSNKITSQVSASINCTFTPVVTRAILRNAVSRGIGNTPLIIEDNEYYTLYDVGDTL